MLAIYNYGPTVRRFLYSQYAANIDVIKLQTAKNISRLTLLYSTHDNRTHAEYEKSHPTTACESAPDQELFAVGNRVNGAHRDYSFEEFQEMLFENFEAQCDECSHSCRRQEVIKKLYHSESSQRAVSELSDKNTQLWYHLAKGLAKTAKRSLPIWALLIFFVCSIPTQNEFHNLHLLMCSFILTSFDLKLELYNAYTKWKSAFTWAEENLDNAQRDLDKIVLPYEENDSSA